MDARRSLVGVTCSYWQRRAAVALQAWMGLNTHGTKSLKLINTHSPFQRHWSEPDCRQPAASYGPWRRPCCEPVPPSAYLRAEWRQRGPGTRGGDEEVSLLAWFIVVICSTRACRFCSDCCATPQCACAVLDIGWGSPKLRGFSLLWLLPWQRGIQHFSSIDLGVIKADKLK